MDLNDQNFEMLKQLDEFMYQCKFVKGDLRDKLIAKINEFLKENSLDNDQHNFVNFNDLRK